MEVVEYDYEGLVSVNVGGSGEAFEFPPNHLWSVCGGVSAASALWRKHEKKISMLANTCYVSELAYF